MTVNHYIKRGEKRGKSSLPCLTYIHGLTNSLHTQTCTHTWVLEVPEEIES